MFLGFGENQLYRTDSTLLGLRERVATKFRIGLPWMKGRWGVGMGPVPLIPLPTNVVHVLGVPVVLPSLPKEASVASEHEVDAAWLLWRHEILRLFNAHKDELLPPDVASKGLKIERIEGR